MKRFTAPSVSLQDWVLAELRRHHRGAAQAITWACLARAAQAAGYKVFKDARNLREEVQALQSKPGEGALICGSSSRPYGIYLAESLAEVDHYVGTLESRIISHAAKIRQQRASANAYFAPPAPPKAAVDQLTLGLGS